MRLVTRKIYRAFPELDRFSDEQCRRFVSAAHASVTRLALRGGVSVAVGFGLGLVLLVGASRLAQELSDRWRLSDPWYWVFWGTLLSLALLLAFVPALVLADLLLRLSLRSLLRRCRTCPQCRYTLLGMRVPSNLIVICPECGHGLKVEPALGELATDDAGVQVYRPEIVREDEAWMAIRKRRQRVIIKWSAIVGGTQLVLFGGTSGGLWWFVHRQADAARAAREPASKILEIQQAAIGIKDGDNGEAEWKRFLELIGEPTEIVSRLQGTGAYSVGGSAIELDFRVLCDNAAGLRGGTPTPLNPEVQDAARRLAADVLAECRSTGVFDRLNGLRELHAPLRPTSESSADSPFQVYDYRLYHATYRMLNVQASRMIEASKAHNIDEYLAALDQSLTCASLMDLQSTRNDRYYSMHVRSQLTGVILQGAAEYPDVRWHQRVLDVLMDHEKRPSQAASLRIMQVQCRNFVHWFFSDADRVRDASLGITNFRDDPTLNYFFRNKVSVGTHSGNIEVIDSIFDFWVEQSGKPCKQQSVSPPSTRGLSLAEGMTAYLGQTVKSESQGQFEYRAAMLTIAIERFRRENERMPGKDEMKLLGIPAEYLTDPTSELPFGIRTKPEPKPGTLLFEVVSGGTGLEDPEDGE